MNSRGTSLVETMVMLGVASAILASLVTLSSQSVESKQDQLERGLAQGMCLDMLERFKRYKPFWPMPGHVSGPPIDEVFGPVELSDGPASVFDVSYLEHMRSMGMNLVPKVTITPHKETRGLFRLEVSMSWKSHRGHPRSISYARWCYAP
jgi:hypothetical protein